MDTNQLSAADRVAKGLQPLTKAQAQEFLRKRAELRAKYGHGTEARASILREFHLTPEETLHLLNQHLWELFVSGATDEEIVEVAYANEDAEIASQN